MISKEDMKSYLNMSIGDVHYLKPPILNSEDDSSVLIKKLKETEYGGFPVSTQLNEIIGIVSSRDVITKLPKILGIDHFIELMQK